MTGVIDLLFLSRFGLSMRRKLVAFIRRWSYLRPKAALDQPSRSGSVLILDFGIRRFALLVGKTFGAVAWWSTARGVAGCLLFESSRWWVRFGICGLQWLGVMVLSSLVGRSCGREACW